MPYGASKLDGLKQVWQGGRTMVLFAFMCSCCLAGSQAAQDLDPSTYHLVKVNENKKNDSAEWEYQLVVDGIPGAIRLGRRVHVNDGAGAIFNDDGLDEKSVNVRWLLPRELLLVSWSTFPLGNGCYTAGAYVLAERSDKGLQEVTREAFLAHCNLGASGYIDTSAVYQWDSENGAIVRKAIYHDYSYHDKKAALSWGIEGGFRRDLVLIETKRAKLKDGVLLKPTYSLALDLGKKKFSGAEVAESFVLFVAPRYQEFGDGECTAAEREAMLRDLNLDKDKVCTGLISGPVIYGPIVRPLSAQDDYYPF